MDENSGKVVEFTVVGADPAAAEKAPGPPRRRWIVALILLTVVVALCVFLYWRGWTVEHVREVIAGDGTEAFFYTAGDDPGFAAVGKGLAVVSDTGVRLMDGAGAAAVSQHFNLRCPAAACNDSACAVYDVGGTTLRVCDLSGGYTTLDPQHSINSVTVNDNGFLAVTAQEDGYKGLVTVYDRSLTAVFEWYAGSGWPLVAEVAPDNHTLAVLCADGEGSTVHFFKINSETEQASYTAPELLLDAHWTRRGTLCLLSETGAYFISDEGEELACCSFGELYLRDYALNGDGFVIFRLSRYRTGDMGQLVTVSDTGEELARLDTPGNLVQLSVSGRQLLALYDDALVLYDSGLTELGRKEDVAGLRAAVLRTDGKALCIETYSAAVYSFE